MYFRNLRYITYMGTKSDNMIMTWLNKLDFSYSELVTMPLILRSF